ncbi:unnamed protein product [Ilex paraguariensis]|uniref:Uncharacterized protein n=1 Tax=Ilex paraguariensis TaxID=185542 RepID=A0ABC8TXY0_9AQUA
MAVREGEMAMAKTTQQQFVPPIVLLMGLVACNLIGGWFIFRSVSTDFQESISDFDDNQEWGEFMFLSGLLTVVVPDAIFFSFHEFFWSKSDAHAADSGQTKSGVDHEIP